VQIARFFEMYMGALTQTTASSQSGLHFITAAAAAAAAAVAAAAAAANKNG
jgi:hypothetical protein